MTGSRSSVGGVALDEVAPDDLRGRVPKRVMALLIVLTVWTAGYQLSVTLLPGLARTVPFEGTASDVAFALGGLLLIARGIRRERAWTLIGVGALCWAAGDVYWTRLLSNLQSPPVPSPADAGYLLFCPLACAGIVSLIKARRGTPPRRCWRTPAPPPWPSVPSAPRWWCNP